MFRKPRSRNVRQRINLQHSDDEDGSPIKSAKLEQEVRTDTFPKAGLSFNDCEEDDTTEFVVKKDKAAIKTKKSHKLRRRVKSEVSEDEEDHQLHLKTEILEVEEDIIVEREVKPSKVKPDPTRIPDEESDRYKELSQSTSTQYSDDTKNKFSSLSTIPDQKTIYEARKRRQALRENQQDQPGPLNLDQPLSLGKDSDAKSKSRLVREDDEHDISDDEDKGRFISSSNLLMNEEETRRNEQLEALRMEQGSDDEDAKSNKSEDEELQRWEQEQIKKAVSQRRITEMKHEYAASRRYNNQPATLSDMGMVLEDEDMEIDSVGETQMPAFFNTDGTYKVNHSYRSLAGMIEHLEIARGRKIEDLKAKRDLYENNQRNLKTDQNTVFQLAESNGKMEIYFKLYQEMKFFTDNVMDCLNDKMTEINEIDQLIMDLQRTRADEISRRRAAARRREKYNRNEGWDSEGEEEYVANAYQETMAKLLQRTELIFADASAEYHDLNQIYKRFIDWLTTDGQSFENAYIDECIPKLIGPLVRIELFQYNPLMPGSKKLEEMEWYKAVLRLGFDNTEVDVDHRMIIGLIPNIVEKIVVPKLTKLITDQYDPLSYTQTLRITTEIDNLTRTYSTLNNKSKIYKKLLNALRQKAQEAVNEEGRIPEHLRQIVTEVIRPKPQEFADPNDIAALLAASKSVMK
ncbi:unnamed protein product [Bursaphelenchus okinawaensis]|uniref:GCF C-terminal domain-containing protein n=1 Tax=Bursaphelenchus okinawaensis TaxID=465554 RepID=A0A811JVN8_9BILA|nr:unnamed protein product [Bursaphelenchus okinawaensis]CAG9085199.1 unnamed protein product [Bursaphelenchus okinawaensis]